MAGAVEPHSLTLTLSSPSPGGAAVCAYPRRRRPHPSTVAAARARAPRGGRTSSHAALGPRSSAAVGAPPLALPARSPPRPPALRRAHMPLSIRPRRQPPPLLLAPLQPLPIRTCLQPPPLVSASPARRRAGRLFPVPAVDEGRCEGERRERREEGESEDTELRC
jgi:hypothetical protein